MRPLAAVSRYLAVFATAGCLLSSVGCFGGQPLPVAGSEEPDQFLNRKGNEELAKKHWFRAREYFRTLVDRFPQSRYRAEAKLGIGDSYIGEDSVESNILAIHEFREFLSFFPAHERADYAQYRIGVAHFRQMLSPARDQTATRDALKEFERFLTNYSTSQLRPEVEKLQRQARDRLSDHEFGVGLTYFRSKWYPGALGRFRALLADDPGYSHKDRLYFYLGETLLKANLKAEAVVYYQRIVDEFQKSEHSSDAKKRIAEIKMANGKPPADVKR